MARSAFSGTQLTDRLARWLDDRQRISGIVQSLRTRAVADHWSSLFGQLAVASFVVCTVTGVILLFFYDPSTAPVTYRGSYGPLQGVQMSRALESTLEVSFEVRGGLLVRQLHHWSASLMIAAIMLHLLRTFFTGGFRRPRTRSWLVWFAILLLGMGAGLSGHILPDDLLSGSSLAVMDGLLKSIPVAGAWLSALVFQGEFPTGAVTTFFPLHVAALPATVLVLLLVLGRLAARHRPAQLPGPGRTEGNVVGRPLPVAIVKRLGFFFIVSGVLTLVAGTVTVNPVWSYGPADPPNATAGGGALWYLAFLDGAQRLVPPGWELVVDGKTWTLALLVPLVVCGLFLTTAMLYPFIERRLTGDDREHHLLTRPRNAPARTAIGVAGLVFYGVLWAAGGSDSIALFFSLGNEGLVHTLQLMLLLGPPSAFLITRSICFGLQRRDREKALHGRETGRIIMLPGGEYAEIHEPLSTYERWLLVGPEDDAALATRLGSLDEAATRSRR